MRNEKYVTNKYKKKKKNNNKKQINKQTNKKTTKQTKTTIVEIFIADGFVMTIEKKKETERFRFN